MHVRKHVHKIRANESSLILGAFKKPPCPFGSLYCDTAQNVGRIYALKAEWILYAPPGLPLTNSTFCPNSAFMSLCGSENKRSQWLLSLHESIEFRIKYITEITDRRGSQNRATSAGIVTTKDHDI